MKTLTYCVLNDQTRLQVCSTECDPLGQACIIKHTLIPVYCTGKGWADSRTSGFTVAGGIRTGEAKFSLLDGGVPIATLAVCLQEPCSAPLWWWLHDGAPTPLPAMGEAPPAAWAALRWDVDDELLPLWVDWWGKHVAYGLTSRQGW